LGGGAGTRLEGALPLVVLNVLLVLNLLLHVLVTLQNLVMLDLAQLQALVHAAFQLLLKRVHFVALLAHQVRLAGQNLLVNVHHELFALLLFQVLGARLHDVSLLIVLLFREVGLDLPQVKELSTLLVHIGQLGLESLPVLFQLMRMLVFEGEHLVLVLLLRVLELLVPVFVKLLVLLDVRLLALLTLLLVHEDHLFHLARILLLLQLSNTVLRHFGLHVAALQFAGASMLLHCSALNKELGAIG
jgi:hypothetical protein